MYTVAEIKELMTQLDQSSLELLDYQDNGQRLIISKKTNHGQSFEDEKASNQATKSVVESQIERNQASTSDPVRPLNEKKASPTGEIISAPLVGVVYLQVDPTQDPFVSVGDRVQKGDVLCIVEAMKLMNDIQATKSGTIKNIFVENNTVVEFGQALFEIDEENE